MEGFLVLGFLIGMQHALEADHLAAIGAMAAEKSGDRRGMVLRGAAWGLGHTITLFVFCAAAILAGLGLTERLGAALEFAVGVMLIGLGLAVFMRLRRKRVHFHVHDHGDGRPHIHAHSHAEAQAPHHRDPHDHAHPRGFPVKALAVGLVHGAAGSAGLLALAVAAAGNTATALAYVGAFGVGSILGMAALSFVASWPLGAVARKAAGVHRCLAVGAGSISILLGGHIIMTTGPETLDLMRSWGELL